MKEFIFTFAPALCIILFIVYVILRILKILDKY